jgi:hypothetical protein
MRQPERLCIVLSRTLPTGISEPPWTIFERMVDLVIEYQSQQIRATHEALNKWRATIRGKD